MNNLKIVLSLACLAFFGGGCYQKSTTNNTVKTAPTTATTSPVADKSVAPTTATRTGGDFDAAMNFYNQKDYEKAAAEFESVTQSDAKNQKAQLYLGRSYRELKKLDGAITAYKKAIELKADDAEANYELGKIYYDRKDFNASLPYIEKASKIKFTSPEYLIALGDNYRELDRCEYAMVPYGKVPGFDEKNTAAYYGMGLCYIELNNRIAASQQVRNLEKYDKALAKKLADLIAK